MEGTPSTHRQEGEGECYCKQRFSDLVFIISFGMSDIRANTACRIHMLEYPLLLLLCRYDKILLYRPDFQKINSYIFIFS